MKTTDQAFVADFTRDVLRGLSSRYLSEQSVPQARWQTTTLLSAIRSVCLTSRVGQRGLARA